MALQSITALSKITLQEPSGSVEFSGIPNTYRDLILVISGSASADSYFRAKINGVTTDQSLVYMMGQSDGASSASDPIATFGTINTNQTTNITHIMDYSASDKHTTFLTRGNRDGRVIAYAQRWAQTTVITSIAADLVSGTINAGTTFALFGRIA